MAGEFEGQCCGIDRASQINYLHMQRKIQRKEDKFLRTHPEARLKNLQAFLAIHLKKDPDTYGDHRTDCSMGKAGRRARWEEIKVKVEQNIEKTKKEVEESHVQQ